MRKKSGMRARAAVLSSAKSFSVRTKRPVTRRAMITAQNVVIHQHTRSVGLTSLNGLSGGGSEYNAMALPTRRARHPP
jgi:hypothetical protein